MQIETESTIQRERTLDTINREREHRDRAQMEIVRIRGRVKNMSLDEKSVERSGNTKRIGQFNERFVKSVSRLSILQQTTPRVGSKEREEAAKIVESL